MICQQEIKPRKGKIPIPAHSAISPHHNGFVIDGTSSPPNSKTAQSRNTVRNFFPPLFALPAVSFAMTKAARTGIPAWIR